MIEPSDSQKEDIQAELVVDAHWSSLSDGDTIIAIKWLPVKGGVDIKKWEKFTNIRLTDDPTHISVNTKKNGKMFLKVEYFKKG
jgi:uncharacterized Zn ribbon protein